VSDKRSTGSQNRERFSSEDERFISLSKRNLNGTGSTYLKWFTTYRSCIYDEMDGYEYCWSTLGSMVNAKILGKSRRL